MREIDYSIMSDKSVLVADDEHLIRFVMEKLLSKKFKKVFLAEDGKEALDIFNKNRPDVVITDIQMPHMNGMELLRIIKEDNEGEPVIIVTGFEDEAHRAKEADAILIKPIKRDELFLTLANVLKDRVALK